jgi:hypothetical protein
MRTVPYAFHNSNDLEPFTLGGMKSITRTRPLSETKVDRSVRLVNDATLKSFADLCEDDVSSDRNPNAYSVTKGMKML